KPVLTKNSAAFYTCSPTKRRTRVVLKKVISMIRKYIYSFGNGKAEGRADMKEILGGKGANLAEMTNIGLPVPSGFTISTEMCNYYLSHQGKYPNNFKKNVLNALQKVEKLTKK